MNDPASPYNPTTSPSPSGSSSFADAAQAARSSVEQNLNDAKRRGEEYVRQHPGTSALSLFGIGFALGVLVGWALAHEDHPSYAARGSQWARGLF